MYSVLLWCWYPKEKQLSALVRFWMRTTGRQKHSDETLRVIKGLKDSLIKNLWRMRNTQLRGEIIQRTTELPSFQKSLYLGMSIDISWVAPKPRTTVWKTYRQIDFAQRKKFLAASLPKMEGAGCTGVSCHSCLKLVSTCQGSLYCVTLASDQRLVQHLDCLWRSDEARHLKMLWAAGMISFLPSSYLVFLSTLFSSLNVYWTDLMFQALWQSAGMPGHMKHTIFAFKELPVWLGDTDRFKNNSQSVSIVQK